MNDRSLLSFSLGPVQSFIAGARSVRDLWTGSYLLAWLTFKAMEPVIRECGEGAFVTPSLEGNPFLRRFRGEPVGDEITTPCLPNRFIAQVPAEKIEELKRQCRQSCLDEWGRISDAVKKRLVEQVEEHDLPHQSGWDRLWGDQVNAVFELVSVALPGGTLNEATRSLCTGNPANDWEMQMDLLAGLRDAVRSVRHTPRYPTPAGNVPQKCSLLGTYEQMGPAQLDESKKFWEKFAEEVREGGERTRGSERLCAISLIKRFAWPAYFAAKLFPNDPKRIQRLRYSDTMTASARIWLRADEAKGSRELDPGELRDEYGRWNGQWLHWPTQHHDASEPRCPDAVWAAIQDKKRKQGPPPGYYAILMMDGDHLGELFKLVGSAAGAGILSNALTDFAIQHVRRVVEDHRGELIYAGGDDVLATCPTQAVMDLARNLQEEFQRSMQYQLKSVLQGHTEKVGHISAGVTVVHYKEDLRFALDQARAAERKAKNSGRNCLALTVCRRSGEHTTTVMGWDQTGAFNQLVGDFIGGVSDRWAYRLRADLPTLQTLPPEAVRSELRRVLNRLEAASKEQREKFIVSVLSFFDAYCGEMKERGRDTSEVLGDFVTLCQSASFLARGRDA